MKESAEKLVEVGFRRTPAAICDEIEQSSAAMIRAGWKLADAVMEEGLGFIHLFFERETNSGEQTPDSL